VYLVVLGKEGNAMQRSGFTKKVELILEEFAAMKRTSVKNSSLREHENYEMQ